MQWWEDGKEEGIRRTTLPHGAWGTRSAGQKDWKPELTAAG